MVMDKTCFILAGWEKGGTGSRPFGLWQDSIPGSSQDSSPGNLKFIYLEMAYAWPSPMPLLMTWKIMEILKSLTLHASPSIHALHLPTFSCLPPSSSLSLSFPHIPLTLTSHLTSLWGGSGREKEAVGMAEWR